MATLYRDYRPQNFSEVLGQEHIKITLQNEIRTNNIAHAFLFCGPRAVGKTTLARIFTKAVNCTNRLENEFEPCGECKNCQTITAGNHLDVVEIDAASNTGVDNVRDNIISYSRLAPNKAKYKVFIIDEVHMLSTFAFNALLKIIEEPPAHVIFILCTTEVHKVPNTIISRCERFDFKRINLKEVVQKLRKIARTEKINIDEDVLEAVARQSNGHLRDAESLLGQIFALGEKNITSKKAELILPHYNNNEIINLLKLILNKEIGEAIALINNLADSGVNMRSFNAELINMLRKMLIFKVNPKLSLSLGFNLGDSLELKISEINNEMTLVQLKYYLQRFLLAYEEKNNLIPQLPLELALIDLNLNDNINTTDSAHGIDNFVKIKAGGTAQVRKLKPTSAIESRQQINREESIKLSTQPSKAKIELSATVEPALQINFTDILKKWPEFLLKIKKYNHSLSFVLQNCQPKDLHNNCLALIFKYKFHQDRINEQSIKQIVEKALFEVFAQKINITAILDENLNLKNSNSSTSESSFASTIESANKLSLNSPPSGVSLKQKENSAELDKTEKSANISSLLNMFGGELIN